MSDSARGSTRLFEELEALERTVESPEAREQLRNVMRVALEDSREGGVFGRVVRGFDRGDLMESLLGSVLFGIPMFVEGGTGEVGAFAFAVSLVVGILYVADIQDVRIQNPILGVLPRRLVGVLGVSFLTAAILMTGWGRIEWGTPLVALANVAVAFVPMSVDGALGDISPRPDSRSVVRGPSPGAPVGCTGHEVPAEMRRGPGASTIRARKTSPRRHQCRALRRDRRRRHSRSATHRD